MFSPVLNCRQVLGIFGYWVSYGKRCLFLIKTVLNGGIGAISFRKKNVLNRGPC